MASASAVETAWVVMQAVAAASCSGSSIGSCGRNNGSSSNTDLQATQRAGKQLSAQEIDGILLKLEDISSAGMRCKSISTAQLTR